MRPVTKAPESVSRSTASHGAVQFSPPHGTRTARLPRELLRAVVMFAASRSCPGRAALTRTAPQSRTARVVPTCSPRPLVAAVGLAAARGKAPDARRHAPRQRRGTIANTGVRADRSHGRVTGGSSPPFWTRCWRRRVGAPPRRLPQRRGADADRCRRDRGRPVPPPPMAAITVGRGRPRKGFDVAAGGAGRARAAAPTCAPSSSAAGPTVRSWPRANGWASAMRSPSSIPSHHAALHTVLAARAVVVPSRREGLGLVAVEAPRARSACDRTRTGGLPEVVTPGAGVLVTPGSPTRWLPFWRRALPLPAPPDPAPAVRAARPVHRRHCTSRDVHTHAIATS